MGIGDSSAKLMGTILDGLSSGSSGATYGAEEEKEVY